VKNPRDTNANTNTQNVFAFNLAIKSSWVQIAGGIVRCNSTHEWHRECYPEHTLNQRSLFLKDPAALQVRFGRVRAALLR
jgi:hypothetical protein